VIDWDLGREGLLVKGKKATAVLLTCVLYTRGETVAVHLLRSLAGHLLTGCLHQASDVAVGAGMLR
jgi:hypothetical protein